METRVVLAIAILATVMTTPRWTAVTRGARAPVPATVPPQEPQPAESPIDARRRADFEAMRNFRPGYPFWQHVFTLPDHSIAYGSSVNGRLLAIFPDTGDWRRHARWADPRLTHILDNQPLARKLDERRDQVALLLERAVGPVQHNSTRGDALLPNARRYGDLLAEWGAIYERFGVPADIGLAQAVLESGLSPTRRSEANAIGFCQWLQKNWKRLNHLAKTIIEARNQTSQAPYCAAYLSVLATKYGSFIPALSEHNAGGTNVGRMLINGEQLGAETVQSQYLLGSKLARDVRVVSGKKYEDVYESYGPRSYLYAEMVFGNTFAVRRLIASTRQVPVHAMRTPRVISLAEITDRTHLSPDEVKRFNPALVDRVPADSTLYLPIYISDFGRDVAFWRHAPSPSYVAVLDDFIRLDPGPERWDNPAFARVLTNFRRRFSATNTEEGHVMATVLGYAMDQARSQHVLLAKFRRSDQVQRLIDRGVLDLNAVRAVRARALP
jgi:transglycosylase-like protein with SLT domain